jgi:N-formylglutamate deformylase
MLTDPLVRAFEKTTIDPNAFHHREHLYVAWCYLRALPLEDALARYVRHLRALVAALGVPDKYHATMTWAYVVLLHEAMDKSPGATFDDLLVKNPALLEPRAGALRAFYAPAELDSQEARRRFVLPRRA